MYALPETLSENSDYVRWAAIRHDEMTERCQCFRGNILQQTAAVTALDTHYAQTRIFSELFDKKYVPLAPMVLIHVKWLLSSDILSATVLRSFISVTNRDVV